MNILQMSPEDIQEYFKSKNPALTYDELLDIVLEQQRTIASLRRQVSDCDHYRMAAEEHWRSEEIERSRQGIFG